MNNDIMTTTTARNRTLTRREAPGYRRRFLPSFLFRMMFILTLLVALLIPHIHVVVADNDMDDASSGIGDGDVHGGPTSATTTTTSIPPITTPPQRPSLPPSRQQQQQPPPKASRRRRDHRPSPFLVVCTVDGTIHVLRALDGSLVGTFQSGKPLVGPSQPLGSTFAASASSSSSEEEENVPTDRRRIVPGLDGRLYVSDDDDKDGLLQPLEITVLDVLQNPVRTCRTSSSSDLNVENVGFVDYDNDDDGEAEAATTTTTTTTECGIVTATKTTSLFALDATSGLLVWQQYPNGTTARHVMDPQKPFDTVSSSSSNNNNDIRTVLLQREDIMVQQIDTDTGKSVWNVTLGTQQALDFGDSLSSMTTRTTSDLPSPSQGLLPGESASSRSSAGGGGGRDSSGSRNRRPRRERQTARDQRNLLLDEYLEELPYVVFSEDGKRLSAVSPNAVSIRLWGHEFPSVVASVFGLNGQSWRTLTVLEEEDLDDDEGRTATAAAEANNNGNHPRLLPESPSSITLYKSPFLHPFVPFFVEQLYDGVDWLLRMTTGTSMNKRPISRQEQILSFQWQNQYQKGSPTFLLPPLQQSTSTKLYDRSSPPLLELPSPNDVRPSVMMTQSGVFLTFPVIVGIVFWFILGVTLGTRFIYKKKKEQWHKAQQQQHQQQLTRVSFHDSLIDSDSRLRQLERTTTSSSIAPNTTSSNRKVFVRSHSLPGKIDRMTNLEHDVGQTNTTNHHHRQKTDLSLATTTTKESDAMSTIPVSSGPLSLALKTVTGKTDGKNAPSRSRAESSPTPATPERPSTAVRATTTSTEASYSLIDGSIPLIQYTRYASEFEELAALGKGGFGSVFQCRNALDGREYAIKKVHIRRDARVSQAEFSKRLQRTLREVKNLALLDHPHVVRYYTAWLEQAKDGDGHSEHFPGSEYYVTTPTTPRKATGINDNESSDFSSSWPGNNGTSRHQRRHSLGDNGISSSRGSAFDDSVSSSQGFRHHNIVGVPDALDDYGFVFDREGDDVDETPTSNVDPLQPLKERKGGGRNDQGKEKNQSSTNLARRAISFQSLSMSSNTEVSTAGRYVESRNQSEGKRNEMQDDEKKKPGRSTTAGEGSTSDAPLKYVLYIQMQFCSQKTIADFLSNKETRKGPTGICSSTGVDIPQALSLFLQIAMGVKSVHSQGLIHRDLKPNNCFLDDAGFVKVGDFGLSRESSDTGGGLSPGIEEDPNSIPSMMKINDNGEITAGVGTRSYASPEQMKGGSDYDASTDIYSLGIILFEMCYPMYTGMERNIVLANLRKYIFPEAWTEKTMVDFPSLHDLLLSMISNKPECRPTAEAVVHRIETILEAFTVSSLDKQHHEGSILLRVETLPRQDVLRHTMQLVQEAALPEKIQIVQYGLRGGTNKQIMEFAVVPESHEDGAVCCKTTLGRTLVDRLRENEQVLLIREVRPRSISMDDK